MSSYTGSSGVAGAVLWMALAAVLQGCGAGSGEAAFGGGSSPRTGGPAASASGLDRVPDHGPCDYFTNGTATVDIESGCAGCSVENEHLAVDGDPQTFATIRTGAEQGGLGGISLRAHAQVGVEYPAGAPTGVMLSWPIGAGQAGYVAGFEVYALHGDESLGSGMYTLIQRPAGYEETALTTAPAVYDGAGIRLLPGAVAEAREVRVHEFCARGD